MPLYGKKHVKIFKLIELAPTSALIIIGALREKNHPHYAR